MLKTKKLLTIILLLIGTSNLFADDLIMWNTNIGLYGGLNANFHNPNFSPAIQIQAVSRKPIFNSNTTSISGFIGGEVNVPILDMLAFTGRLTYNATGVEFTENIRTTENLLDVSLSYLDINPSLKFYNILPLNSLYLKLGLNAEIPLYKRYNFTQTIGQVKTSKDGSIPDPAFRLAVAAGVGYVFHISEKLYLSPELSFHFPFTKVSSDVSWDSWKFPQLRLGISLTYDLYKKDKDTLEAHSPDMEITISKINYYNNAGELQDTKHITLEEVEYGELFPLVPYIFYDVNETEPSEAYQPKDEENLAGTYLTEENLPNEAIGINNKIIDIVGQRMEKDDKAILTVTGTIDGKYETDIEVSEERANSIKNYLLKTYDIGENRIQTRAQRLPEKPSAQTVQDGIEENRRVELSSNSPTLLAPIFIKGDKQRLAYPEVVEFVPKTNVDTLTAWELEVVQSGRVVKKITGGYNEFLQPIKWHIAPNELTASQVPIDYTFTIFKNDKINKTSGSIPIEFISFAKKKTIEQADRSINKYSLILFDFDKSDISEEDKQIIDLYIIPDIKYKSKVEIFGFTDRIGNAEYNKRLAKARADAVKDYILTKNKNVEVRTYGIDAKEAPFDNNTALGRQLSRTVQVFLVTPKE